MAKVKITETVLRDAHQSLIATRMSTEEMLPVLKEAGVVTEHIDTFESTITKDDVLVLVDCQNDFFPEGTVEDGGRFGVAVQNVFS